jgi:amino acid adenylation domain-containing protein
VLDQLSTAVAQLLQGRGVCAGQLVPFLADRSCDWPVAVLGILKAGCGFVPLDPRWPEQRQRQVIEQCGADILVLAGVGSGQLQTTTIEVPQVVSGESEANVFVPAQGELVAYAISTSGTEGIPKLAINSHVGLRHLVDCLLGEVYLDLGAPLRVSVAAGIAFDPWIQQMFAALCGGHTLVILGEEERRDGRLLARFLIDRQIDVADGTPSQLILLSQPGSMIPGNLPVRKFIIGGEKMLSAEMRRLYDRYPQASFTMVNIYGVAECAVDSIAFSFERQSQPQTELVPIGKPLGQTRIRIIDELQRDVVDGKPGELLLGGPGTGIGYAGDPARTESRYGNLDDMRMYRTGDAAAFDEDGNVVILGRLDQDEVKLSGRRVNLREIESVIRQYRPVRLELPIFAPQRSHRMCIRCVVSEAHPGVKLDDQGICNICRAWEGWGPLAAQYFENLDALKRLTAAAKATSSSPYDVLLLFSGGKDSTYVLYKLIDLKLKVKTFTFDNNFISEAAFDNIRRTTEALGVDHVTLDAAKMKDIFKESLRVDATVCDGCFRALTTLSTQLAIAEGINVVITGLSRGQMLDTKLGKLFKENIFDPGEIDRSLLARRKMYHGHRDSFYELLSEEIDETKLSRIEFVDYFRYDAVSGPEILGYLTHQDPRFKRPGDTGFCSTNCRANDMGIVVHQSMKGYHNYAAPLSWDVRLGTLTRDEALHKLKGEPRHDDVAVGLKMIGYTPPQVLTANVVLVDDVPVAFITAECRLSMNLLDNYLRSILPDYMVPARIYQIDSLLLTANGKADLEDLRRRDIESRQPKSALMPRTPTEAVLIEVWSEIFGMPPARFDQDFFDSGGDSLKAAMFIVSIEQHLPVELPMATIFNNPTLESMARTIDSRTESEVEELLVLKEVDA